MKHCSKCNTDKPLDKFAWKNKAKGTRSTWCKTCQSNASKIHYQNNKTYYADKARVSNPMMLERNKAFIVQWLLTHPCVDCGETDIEVLQFDHVKMVGNKGKRISSFIQHSLERLQKEINKCEVRCANCHYRRTRKQMGWERVI